MAIPISNYDSELITSDQEQLMIISSQLARDNEVASLFLAQEHRDKEGIRFKDENQIYHKYSICGTSLETVGRYGIGLQLYFLFIKQLGC